MLMFFQSVFLMLILSFFYVIGYHKILNILMINHYKSIICVEKKKIDYITRIIKLPSSIIMYCYQIPTDQLQ